MESIFSVHSLSRGVDVPCGPRPTAGVRSDALSRDAVTVLQRLPARKGLSASKLSRNAFSHAPPSLSSVRRSSRSLAPRAQTGSNPPQPEEEGKTPFGYTRKDVILIGVAITALGYGTRYGLEYFFGFDGLQAGTITQLVVVLGLCFGWVSTYLWRVGNKEMTYAKQLRDYEAAVMQKRLEAMSETELEAMLAEVEEEKSRLKEKKAKIASKE